jgi:hypothetical protein
MPENFTLLAHWRGAWHNRTDKLLTLLRICRKHKKGIVVIDFVAGIADSMAGCPGERSEDENKSIPQR